MQILSGVDNQVQLKIQEAQEKAAESSQKAWETVGRTFESAINSQVSGLLRGTETMQQAFKNMVASAIEDLIKLGLKMAEDAVLMELFNIATGGVGGLLGGGGAFGLPIRAYASGTPFVGNTGLALIHKGEAVIPASSNPFSFNGAPATPGSVKNGGDTTQNPWNVTSNASDPRQVAQEVAGLWSRNPSMRPKY